MSEPGAARHAYEMRVTHLWTGHRASEEAAQLKQVADAALAEADELIMRLVGERDAMKCCGNCAHVAELSGLMCGYGDGPLECFEADHCHFTPSRWQPREEAR